MHIGDRISELRLSKKLSQEELAKKLFVSNKTISSWETNRTEPGLEIIVKLSEILDCSVVYLIYGNIKKNDIEKLLLNLDANPYTQKNKDFRYTLSLIYELIEEEFQDTFDTKNNPLRATDLILDDVEGKVFITPPYNFDFY